ncbi:MAG TPA: sigma-54 dependent transcriptional regulator [Bdellovibrionota bacterium]|jgi:DNA-binding NtrC family response regulator
MKANQLLVVDDDGVTRDLLREVFEKEGYEVSLAASGEEALQKLSGGSFPLVLSDIRMLGLDGIELLGRIRKGHPETFVILMTGFGNLEGAVRAIQEGAYDYISKPFRIHELKALVARAHKQWKQLREAGAPAAQEPIRLEKRTLIGHSPMIVEVYKSLARAALSSSSVLIIGESGTGKELVARAIHENSSRKGKRMLAVNCGALADSLLESELFGHAKGAFTGAVQEKKGLLEEANGGTLFLDEIGDVSPSLQVKLLRFLQEGEFKPVGSNENRHSDLRVVAATHRNLEELIRTGKFREDLFYRLKVIEIHLPPLRDRPEDLPDLVNHFLARYSEQNGKRISHVSPEAMALLREHSWPGNVRELEHCIERAVAMSKSSVLFPEDFSGFVGEQVAATGAKQESISQSKGASLEDIEKEHILRVLRETNYNKSKASAVLGIDRATLYRKAQRYGIELSKGD